MGKRFGLQVSAVLASLVLCACANPSSPGPTESESTSPTEGESGSTEPDGTPSSPSATESGSTKTRRTIVAHGDPRGDVEGIGPRADDYYQAKPASPRQQYLDIIGTSVGYTAAEVLVRIGFAVFPPGPRVVGYTVWASFKNKTFGSRSVEVDQGRVGEPTIRMYGGDQYKRIACDGLDRSIDHGHDAMTIVIPRICLEDPQWIRVHAGSSAREENAAIQTIEHGLTDGFDDRFEERYMFARIPNL